MTKETHSLHPGVAVMLTVNDSLTCSHDATFNQVFTVSSERSILEIDFFFKKKIVKGKESIIYPFRVLPLSCTLLFSCKSCNG